MKAVNGKKVLLGVSLGTIMAFGTMSSAFAADLNHPNAAVHKHVNSLTAPTLSAVAGNASLPSLN
jgi:hypothetical protein